MIPNVTDHESYCSSFILYCLDFFPTQVNRKMEDKNAGCMVTNYIKQYLNKCNSKTTFGTRFLPFLPAIEEEYTFTILPKQNSGKNPKQITSLSVAI